MALGNSVDDDGDGLSECDGDCDDVEAGSFALPPEVIGLAWLGDKETLVWNSVAAVAGPRTKYDLPRGSLDQIAGGVAEVCVAPGILQATTTDPALPASGEGFWYLVRGRNTCGPGTYGFSSDGTERTTPICP
jgi:hypothetical protein